MPIAIVTGSGGLIGSESAGHFIERGYDVLGIENDMRAVFFGPSASTAHTSDRLSERYGDSFRSLDLDIRDRDGVEKVFAEHSGRIELVIHTAAQPSHDWAASDPHTDFTVNANGTLNLLQAARQHAPAAPFIFCSTNKVYGDLPNYLPLEHVGDRLELPEDHQYHKGIDTTMSIDASTHSLFGVSKAAADLLVQEYGRYFEMPTVCFRGGCLTGPNHAGARLHGFLSYLMRCTITGDPYTVYGYDGLQVRDNIHSADLVAAFEAFQQAPRAAAVYNIGGGRQSNCSMLEAIDACERIAGRELDWTLADDNRIGDHRWWISDLEPFKRDYPDWDIRYGVEEILVEIHDHNVELDSGGHAVFVSRPDGLPSAILLDRDGVLTEPVLDPVTGTLESPLHAADVRLVNGASEAVAMLKAHAISLVVVSNQPAAAKGTVTVEELRAVHDRTVELLAADGLTLDGWEYCLHHPDAVVPELKVDCDCRKPEPGLLVRALAALNVPAGEAWMVGDADRDIVAGKRAGVRTALIEHPGSAHRREGEEPDARAASLLEFAARLESIVAAR